jgi:hypothetical protein
MPERAINTKSATGCLLILVPAALTMSALFVAWPIILGVTLLIAGGNLWQNNQWSKTARSIDPIFQQLIVKNRGEITPLDLSIDAKVSGHVSNRYLAAKAVEFGTGSRQHPERGQVYYFVSINTLGSIFDDSELATSSLMPATIPVIAAPADRPEVAPAEVSESGSTPSVTTPLASSLSIPSEPIPEPDAPTPPTVTAESSDLSQSDKTSTSTITPVSKEVTPSPVAEVPTADAANLPVTAAHTVPPANSPLVKIIQSELAKRLDVHSSTIYKRRSEPNFTDWTRNRDPDGLAWSYLEDTKEYYRVDT